MNLEIFGELNSADEHGIVVVSIYGPGMLSVTVDDHSYENDGVVLTTVRAKQLIYALEAMIGIAEKEQRDFIGDASDIVLTYERRAKEGR
jgi:hypothetical protein